MRGEPPREFARGTRQALDARWLAYLAESAIHPAEPTVPHPLFARAVYEFNGGRCLESHETWELAWRDTPYPERLFHLALAKIGAAFAHAQRGNAHGARRLLTDGLHVLEPFRPSYHGIDVERFEREARAWLAAYDGRDPALEQPRLHAG
ncbi:MAG: DUF309 domain-containing protein [SAR202 cluster bacterium]|nr:DUF309 domain-containing protein [SAR202 cluster bacterium]